MNSNLKMTVERSKRRSYFLSLVFITKSLFHCIFSRRVKISLLPCWYILNEEQRSCTCFKKRLRRNYVPVNSKTAHPPPPGQTPGRLIFLKNFGQIPRYVASLAGQMPHLLELQRGSNPPPSRHVKAAVETSSAKFSATTNFLVSLSSLHTLNKGIFNDNNRKTHVESTRAMIRERGSPAESKNCEILLLPTADRRFDTKVKCPTGRASFWVKFPPVRSLTRVKFFRHGLHEKQIFIYFFYLNCYY